MTNDLNDYSGVSYNAETRSLLAVQTHVVSGVWVVPSGDLKVQAVARGHFPLDAATQIASGTSPVNPCDSPAAKARCRRAFLLMAGGSFTKKAIRPARGSGACRPTVASQPPSAETRAQKPDVSPDGKLIAYYTLDSDSASSPWIFGAMPFEGGGLLKRFTFSPTVGERLVRWVPGGWGLTYVDSPGGVSNIWVQTLQGGAPRQLSDFKAERIGSFDWSPDGRRLAVVGGTETSDVVLIEAKSE